MLDGTCKYCLPFSDVYVYGGFDGSQILGDFWQLDLEHLQWTQMSCKQLLPSYFSSSAVTQVQQAPKNEIFIVLDCERYLESGWANIYIRWRLQHGPEDKNQQTALDVAGGSQPQRHGVGSSPSLPARRGRPAFQVTGVRRGPK